MAPRPRLLLHGTAGGQLWLSVGDQGFPEEGWSDVVEPLLEEWIPQLLPLISGHGGAAVLTFMDGPYQARLDSVGGFDWCIREFAGRKEIGCHTVDGSTFGDSLLEVIRVTRADRLQAWLPHVEGAIAASR